jgi:RHS repeat-associated protein
MMKAAIRLLAVCIGFCLTAFVVVVPASLADASSSLGGLGTPVFERALEVPGAHLLLGNEGAVASEEAERATPGAVAEREISRTAYKGLNRGAAIALAEKDFRIARPSWTSPEGQGAGHITKYLGDATAVEALPNGKHLLIQSTVPLLSTVGSGQSEPTSLTLEDKGDSYQPANPPVSVSISKTPSGGVTLPLEISAAPEQAAAPEGSVVVGNRVVYPGTATDTDFMAEPVPGGVETSWQLRSEASPSANGLRFSLPVGASLQLSTSVPGGAEIVREGQALALIPPATASEANGSALQASYSINGNVLVTHVPLSGSVAFPVMVDPVIIGYYGALNGSTVWSGWSSGDNCGGCFSLYGGTTYRVALVNPGAPAGAYGQWYIYAPRSGQTGGAGITRVDLTGVRHSGNNETTFEAAIGESTGSNPVWTYNGDEGAQGASPLVTGGNVNEAIAFCAQGAGGHDGGEQPLCNENYTGKYFANELAVGPGALNEYGFYEFTGAAIRYVDNTPPNIAHFENLPHGWYQYGTTALRIVGEDQGVGVGSFSLEIPPGHLNEQGQPFFAENLPCDANNGFDGCAELSESKNINLSGLTTGVYTLGGYVYDAVGNLREITEGSKNEDPKIYIDHTPPKFTPFGGTLYEANGGTIGSGNYQLTFGAEDGSTSAPQVGVQSFTVSVDGSKTAEVVSQCSFPSGVPLANCFGLSGNWTMEGQKYGAGLHTISVTAKDWLGNEVTESFHVTVNEAPYEAVGPGMVNTRTGDYKMTTTDVSVASAGASLTLGRAYDSRNLGQGSTGPLGPQWSLSLPDASANGMWQNLKVLINGSVQATMTNGSIINFSLSGSTYVSPPGYQTDVLTKTSSSPLEYRLTDSAGNSTLFTRASSGVESEPVLVPSGTMQATGAGGLNKVTYTFTKTTEGIIEPTRVVAPYPTTINCLKEHTEELVAGCREVTFNYATSTTATGEGSSEWGDYKGRLTRVYFTAWNPSPAIKAMETTLVAQYSYDTKGRLRAEWDPRISPALKTEYGYDPEGHVTALTPPGQETWAFTYGTTAGDGNKGRLLKVLQAPAATALWNGVSLKATEPPRISGTTVVGNRMTVSDGAWSPTPVSYAYRWSDCNTSDAECVTILGATNANYTPTSSDLGHTLDAEVTAVNGGGSVTLAVFSPIVTSTAVGYEQTIDGGNSLNAASCVPATTSCVVSDSKGNAFSATNVNTSSSATWNSWSGPGTSPSEAVNCPTSSLCLLADGSEGGYGGNLYDATSLGGAWSLAYSPAYGVDSISCPSSSFCVTGQDGIGFFRYSTTPASMSWTLEDQGTASMNGVSCLSSSFCAIVDGSGSVHVASTTSQVESSAWTTTAIDSGVAQKGIACTSTTSCLAIDSQGVLNLTVASNGTVTVSKQNIDATNTLTAITCTTSSTCVTVDNKGNIFVSTNNGASWAKVYTLGDDLTSVSCASSSLCVAADTGGTVTAFNSAGGGTVHEGELRAPQPGTTIEYNVPLSGTGLPNLTKTEVEKWAQKDIPAEAAAVAVFPPDEPQTWPASNYNRATIYYLDSANRVVNVTGPTGGISTSEYDAHDNHTRELTPVNRATALKEAKPAEAAEHLSTTFSYNGEGTELNSTLGPEHKIKLPSGTEAQRRKIVKYSYDEGAPSEGGPYRLVTTTKEAAYNEVGHSEEDVKTVTKSYSGGSNLGWKLHEPTSTVTDPTGLKLTYNMVYSPTTGAVTETQMPGGGSGNAGAHTSQIVYYTPGEEASVATCRKHPEWANMPCQTQPAHQPEIGGLPSVAVTTFTYNMWDETEVTKSTSGESSRTETQTYDSAGRVATKETASTTGGSLPKATYEYSTETGLPTKQHTGTGAQEQKIISVYNNVGQMTSYTDADATTATYEYENGGDGRLKKSNDGKGGQTYIYNEKTGELTELTDTAAGTFNATYDVEGKLLTEKLPDGLTANLTYNATNEPVGLEYHKASNCGTSCTWFTDTVVPSIHGEWMSQNSSLAAQNYTYDAAGRLTQVQNTPAGKGCTTRIYTYDADGNRTSITTRAPGSEGKCATEGGTVESHTYDTADRLMDTGIEYNPFGDIKTLSPADAGGSKLTSQYYVDGQVESQSQGEQTIGYNLDPGRRIRETVSTGKTTATEVQNYPSAGDTPSWSSEPSGKSTRNIQGIGDGLDAIQHNSEAPVLQLANLHGDIIATAYDSESQTTLASTIAEANEYGVPATEAPPKYSWLGAHEQPTELPSGVSAMGSRSYIPQLGRFLQPDPSPGGSANAYAYTHGNPLNETDLSGAWSLNETSGGLSAVGAGEGTQLTGGTGIAAGAIMPAPVNAQIEEAFEADPPWDQVVAGDEEYEEYEEEEGEEFEEAAYHTGSKSADKEVHVEEGLLLQPLGGEDKSSEGRTISRSMVRLCEHDLGKKACASYVGFFGWLKKEVKSKWRSLKKAAKSTWKAIKASVISSFHALGYGDLLCYRDGCLEGAATIYDGYECAEEGDCEAFSQDLSENI